MLGAGKIFFPREKQTDWLSNAKMVSTENIDIQVTCGQSRLYLGMCVCVCTYICITMGKDAMNLKFCKESLMGQKRGRWCNYKLKGKTERKD